MKAVHGMEKKVWKEVVFMAVWCGWSLQPLVAWRTLANRSKKLQDLCCCVLAVSITLLFTGIEQHTPESVGPQATPSLSMPRVGLVLG